MIDFTLNTFIRLLCCLKDQEYSFQTYAGFIKNPSPNAIVLRNDVDAKKTNSLKTAKIGNVLGIKGTYYFRMVPGSFDEQITKQIYEMGHEIGYHYEDLSKCATRGMWYAKRSPIQHDLQDPHTLHDLHDLQDKYLPDRKLVSIR